jgi:hypothetical protein
MKGSLDCPQWKASETQKVWDPGEKMVVAVYGKGIWDPSDVTVIIYILSFWTGSIHAQRKCPTPVCATARRATAACRFIPRHFARCRRAPRAVPLPPHSHAADRGGTELPLPPAAAT